MQVSLPAHRPRQDRRSLLVPLVTVVGTAWFALWACAPMSTFPTPGSMGENSNEFTLAANATADSSPMISGYVPPCEGFSVQFTYAHRFNHLHLGGGVFGGTSSWVGGGVFFGGLFPVGPLQMGFTTSLGFAWAAVGMPVTLPLGDHVWLYTEPSVGYRARLLRVPVGAGFRLGKHLTLSPEVAVEYGDLDSPSRTTSALPPGLGLTGALSVGAGL